jgi:aspartyl-tRNA(Asn)/glutamyl-tRNA(Gln) amidotransferase subunit A
LTCRDLVEQSLARAEKAKSHLRAFVTLTADEALSAAAVLDEELRVGIDRGPLHGIPVIHKDLFDTAGVQTTMGSRFFGGRVPAHDSVVVARLKKAGTVALGKTNMSECAVGLSGSNSFYGEVRNGCDDTRSAGGSSGGTGAAIASGVCLVGTGTDTGGSIRAPAAYNGIVGLRPTRGLIDMQGVFPRSQTLDVAGPMGRSVADVAALLTGMVDRSGGHDYLRALDEDVAGVRIGIVPGWSDDCEEEHVRQCLSGALSILNDIGIEVVEVPFDLRLAQLIDATLCILRYEFAAIVRGVEGFRQDLFGPGVQGDMEKAARLSVQQYCRALEFRAEFSVALSAALDRVDFVAAPTVPAVAPLLGADAMRFECARRTLLPASLAGVPAISLPCTAGQAGLPVGLQLVGPPFSEAHLLRVAAAIQKRSEG